MSKPATYNRIAEIIKSQCDKLDKDFFIVGLTRGGLIPASMYARFSGATLLGSFDPKSENGNTFLTNWVRQNNELISVHDFVFCDDILDSGKTFRTMLEMFPDAHFAFVYVRNKTWNELTKAEKKHIIATPKKIMDDHYVDFPWEQWDEPICQ